MKNGGAFQRGWMKSWPKFYKVFDKTSAFILGYARLHSSWLKLKRMGTITIKTDYFNTRLNILRHYSHVNNHYKID